MLLPIYPLLSPTPRTPSRKSSRTVFRKFRESPSKSSTLAISSPSEHPLKVRRVAQKAVKNPTNHGTKEFQSRSLQQEIKFSENPSEVLQMWKTPRYEMRADEILLLVDMGNQLACTTKLKSIIILWFTYRHAVLTKHDIFPLAMVE